MRSPAPPKTLTCLSNRTPITARRFIRPSPNSAHHSQVKGVDFDRAWEKRVETTVDPDTGLKAFLISRDDLIAAKLATGRPQDLADVAALRKAAERLGQSP